MITCFRSAALALLCASLASVASAQSTEMKAMAQEFGQSAKANAQALRMYTWNMTVTVTLKGDTKPAKLFAMRFGPDGKIEKTVLTPPAPPDQTPGLRGRIKKKKIAEFKEWAGDLVELCKNYLTPSPALLQSFFAKVLTAPAPGGFVQLYADGVISPGDRLTYEIDPKTQALHRVLFHATLEDDPIDGTVQFANVPGGGPSYASMTIVNAPAKKLTARIENLHYVRQ
ncbi:MAG TPA: hypothetical protein VNG89_08490 [Vicinamibacterales bacterium]|nr:hypothetical protein [Vicinamibacterales bacterium]